MKNFGRALRQSLRYRFTILFIFLTSLIVAVFWGANISAVYPFVEVVFKGESMHDWVDNKISEADEETQRLQKEIASLRAARNEDAGKKNEELSKQVAHLQNRMEAEKSAAATLKNVRPYIYRYMPNNAFDTLVLIVVFLAVATFLKNMCLMANGILISRFGNRLTMEMRQQFFGHVMQSDLEMIDRRGPSELMNRIANDVPGTVGGITLLFGKTLREPLKLLVCLIGASLICWRLMLASFVFAPLAIFLMTRLAKLIRNNSRKSMEDMGLIYTKLNNTLNNVDTIKAFTMEEQEKKGFQGLCKSLYRKQMKGTIYGSLVSPCNELMGIGVICLSLLAGGYLVLNEATHLWGIQMTDRPLSIGSLLMFYGFLVGISDPARKLSGIYAALQGCAAAADRVYEILDDAPKVIDPEDPQPLPESIGDIIFDNVSFEYVQDQPVLRNVNFRIVAGESLAIVGPNGCGKSTLTKLLLRFYNPDEGCVRLGYTDICNVRQTELRSRIGIVTQHTPLFGGSVIENIRYGQPEATYEQVVEASKRSHSHQFITTVLENGYESDVGAWGGRLSGGQKQRIVLARAILRDPDIFILDEATSQIDPESEQLIQQALTKFMKGRTTIIITHRMSTLALANRIMVMDEGRILDIGTHQELIGRCDLYQRLYQAGFRESA
ncbi:MAG: ATP-binding cassette domain-containing protein [Planctomycetes bacterium]|nr:ATP-binding cassette domain-containing protein [Planctomycetota bacterium]